MTAPVLFTDRLRLDGFRADDLDPLTALWAQPEVYRFIGDGNPRPREDVWLRLLRAVGQWTLFDYGLWVVRDRTDGTVLGEIGLLEARRTIEPALDVPELGWMLGREAQGRGLAREALAAILAWADARGLTRTCCIIDAGNAASIRLALAAGYTGAGVALYKDKPINLYRRDGRSTERAGT